MAIAMAMATAMAMAMAKAMAVAVIRPGYAYRGRPPRKSTFHEKCSLKPILVISGPSRPKKRLRLEILRRIDLAGGLEVKIETIS